MPDSENNNSSNIKTIARNVLFGFGETVGLRLTNFIFGIVIIRTLGDTNFGQYSIVLAWASLFSVIGDVGVSQFFTREIARDREKAMIWFWDVVWIRLILSFVASVVTVGAAIIYGYSNDIVIGIALFTFGYFIQAFLEPLSGVLVGYERLDVISVLSVIGQICFIAFGALFLFFGYGYLSLIAVSFINLPLLIALTLWVVRRNKLGPPPFKLHFNEWWFLFKSGLPFAITQLSLSFAFDSDTILLSRFQPDDAVGWYATAYRLMLSLMVFYGPFGGAILPTLSRQHALDPESVKPWYHRSVRMMLLLTLPLALGGTLVADKLILLLYGPALLPAAIVFAILVWYLPFTYFTAFAGQFANIVKREGGSAKIFVAEGFLNITLNLILIPQFGLIGAALATVTTDVAGSALFYFMFRAELGPGLQLKRILRIVISTVIMGIVAVSLRQFDLPIIITASGVVYALAVWFFGGISEEEKQVVTGQIMSRIRRFHPAST